MEEAPQEAEEEPLDIFLIPLAPTCCSSTQNSSTSYEAHTPPSIQVNIDLVERISESSRFVSDEEVQEKTHSWIPNTGNIRSHISHYLRTIELYWHMKLLLGRALMEKKMTRKKLCFSWMRYMLICGSRTSR
jgi:hypothetical protein